MVNECSHNDVTDIERASETAVATSDITSGRIRVGAGPLRTDLQVREHRQSIRKWCDRETSNDCESHFQKKMRRFCFKDIICDLVWSVTYFLNIGITAKIKMAYSWAVWVNKAAGHGSYAPRKGVEKRKNESFRFFLAYFGVSLWRHFPEEYR